VDANEIEEAAAERDRTIAFARVVKQASQLIADIRLTDQECVSSAVRQRTETRWRNARQWDRMPAQTAQHAYEAICPRGVRSCDDEHRRN
jgi:hypothetical protein